MSHDRLKYLKENLLCCAENQMHNLEEVDAKEFGEVIDMIKDLEEALYYASITEAMEESHNNNHQERMYYQEMMPYPGSYPMRGMKRNSSKEKEEYYRQPYEEGKERDYREGRSPMNRRKYLEAKEYNSDRASQMRELEQYAQELTQDIVDMIEDASSEEKQYLEKKLVTLASKVGQMK